MRIGIDLRFTAASCMGTGTYAESTTLALAQATQDSDELIAFVDDPLPPTLADLVTKRVLPKVTAGQHHLLGQRLLFDAALERERLEVFFAPTGIAPLARAVPCIITIHDLLFEHAPQYFGDHLLAYLRREIPRSVHAAAGIIAISEHTKADLIRQYHVDAEKIRVIPQGLKSCFATTPAPDRVAASTRAWGITGPYVLTVTNHAPHKNTAFAIDVFARWCAATGDRSHHLVIAGGGPTPQQPVEPSHLAERAGIRERVIITGRVSDDHLVGLLAGAKAVLVPSLHEGWGLPPLEAIAMGTPVIVSDRGGLPEAVGDAGIVLPLDEPERWTSALRHLLSVGPTTTLRAAMTQRTATVLQPAGAALRSWFSEVLGRARRRRDVLPPPPKPVPTSVATAGRGSASLSGCLIIRNGIRLGYPFVEAIHAVIDYVDEMIVVDGCSDDETWSVLQRMAAVCPKLRISQNPWPPMTRGGRVIADATNHALRLCQSSHILSIQADEIHAPTNLIRLRDLLTQGFDYAAMPFIHFRTSWWHILQNPAYTATIRCVPNHPTVQSIDDGTTFSGPQGRCALPDFFPEKIYHVGWVYTPNIIAKHRNHATLYTDHPSYQQKAMKAERLGDSPEPEQLATIDDEYRLEPFTGQHPDCIAHLLSQERYDVTDGLARWCAAHAVLEPSKPY